MIAYGSFIRGGDVDGLGLVISMHSRLGLVVNYRGKLRYFVWTKSREVSDLHQSVIENLFSLEGLKGVAW